MGKFHEFWFGPPVVQQPDPVWPVQEPVVDEVRSSPSGEPSPLILPPSRSSFSYVQPREARKVATVERSVEIIVNMVTLMDLQVYRNGKVIESPTLITAPIEGEFSNGSFVQQAVWSLALWGNAYVRLYGNPTSSLEVLDPDSVTVTKENGKVKYYVAGKLVQSNKIAHLKLHRMPGCTMGHGPLQGAEGELRAALMLNEFMQSWFDPSGVPRGVLTSTQTVNPKQQADLIEAFEAFLNEHKNILLPLGIKYETIAVKPIEVQYAELMEANVRAIARVFGIPADMLLSSLSGNSMTYTNMIESNQRFLQNTLSRYMNEIEEFLTSLLPRNQTVRFNEEMLLRLTPEALWAMRKTQWEIGYFSGSELRTQEGLPPLPEPTVKPTEIFPENEKKVQE